MKAIECNLLNAPTQYIAHQCNCTSRGSAGLARQIFDAYPEAEYKLVPIEMAIRFGMTSPKTGKPERIPNSPGSISVHGRVINCYAQRFPGHPRGGDISTMRLKWFRQCLWSISKIPGIQSVAFPYKIGCGLAGGNWENDYYPLLERFNSYCESVGIEVILCKRKGD